jgi:hypothetical protein
VKASFFARSYIKSGPESSAQDSDFNLKRVLFSQTTEVDFFNSIGSM